ncbi:hypothetical protein SK128_002665 [Halocaridina rubra]|uniref:LicD/FKTN/FKRP nucleotidyltransferase domain-containing protein n=1 Tax=Halocaridina rubra TaxID=373956 RepID=A0AAN9AFW5_HALRR
MSIRRRFCFSSRIYMTQRKTVAMLVLVATFFLFFFIEVKETDLGIMEGFIRLRQRFKPWSSDVCIMAVDQRRRLAATIADVQREINKLAGIENAIDAKWALKLAAVVEELDPRMNLSQKSWDFSAKLPDMKTEIIQAPQHVCQELYLGSQYDMPFKQHGMDTENCTHIPHFKKVVTAVLPAMNWNSDTVNLILDNIRELYSIPIIAIVQKGNSIQKNYEGLTVIKLTKDKDDGTIINEAIEQVRTPFTFLGLSLAQFNNQTSLERLVRMLDELKHVKVAGGAARDTRGHWTHGCLQQRMANYQAYYTEGYYYSKYECMYCDDLLTPFAASTQLLRNISFTSGLSGPVLYRDWFAKVRNSGYLTVTCPDVMFYVNNHPLMLKQDWTKMGKLWVLEKIRAYDGQTFVFPCELVGISCQYPLAIINSFLLPPCCITTIEKYMGYIADYGEKYNLTYELQAGSALAAVKMGGQMPWDYDADIVYKCKDYNKWMEFADILKDIPCSIKVITKHRYFEIVCPNVFIDMICYNYNSTSQIYLPPEYKNIPTVVNYSGRYLAVSANPGLYSRNRMGLEDLKHAGHWRTSDGNGIPGVWNDCEYPNHHSCLNHYPGEGNLPFLKPFLRL